MDGNIIIGAIALVVAMVLLTILAVWCIRIINHIDRKGCRTSRETLKELTSGR